MTTNLDYVNTFKINKKDSPSINCEEFAISLLKKYGNTLYILLNFEGITDDKIIGEILSRIIEISCIKINSPEAHKAKPAIFSSAFQVIKELHSKNPRATQKLTPPMIAITPYLHTLSSLSFEKRFAYILKIKNKLTYRELETVLEIHRAEVSKLLTEAREQIRLSLSTLNLLPFNQRALLCSITYKHLSPYLDNELNILHTVDVQDHLKDCDNCLKILADHQYIERQFDNFPTIPEEKLIEIYLNSISSRENSIQSTYLLTTNDQKNIINTSHQTKIPTYTNFFHKILQFLKSSIHSILSHSNEK